MRRLCMVLVLLACCFSLAAQPNEVTLVVTGEGATKEEATNNVLRSAVEQAFGVFVSANTTILNDEIVRDEIATITSGNIKSFKELAYNEKSDGTRSITMEVVVSVSNLIAYSKSHGSSAEFAGALFGATLKMREVNKANEEKAVENLLLGINPYQLFNTQITVGTPLLSSICSFMFNEELVSYDSSSEYPNVYIPKSIQVPETQWDKSYNLPITISYYPTEYGLLMFDQLRNLLLNLSIEQEREQYDKENEEYYVFALNGEKTYLRSPKTKDLLVDYLSSIVRYSIFGGWDLVVSCGDKKYIYDLWTSYCAQGRHEKEYYKSINLELFHSLPLSFECFWAARYYNVDDIKYLATEKFQISETRADKKYLADNYGQWWPRYDFLNGRSLRINSESPSRYQDPAMLLIPRQKEEPIDVMTYDGEEPIALCRFYHAYRLFITPYGSGWGGVTGTGHSYLLGETHDCDRFDSKPLKGMRERINEHRAAKTMKYPSRFLAEIKIAEIKIEEPAYQISFYLPISKERLTTVTSVEIISEDSE